MPRVKHMDENTPSVRVTYTAKLVIDVVDADALHSAALASFDEAMSGDDAVIGDEEGVEEDRQGIAEDHCAAITWLMDAYVMVDAIPGVDLSESSEIVGPDDPEESSAWAFHRCGGPGP